MFGISVDLTFFKEIVYNPIPSEVRLLDKLLYRTSRKNMIGKIFFDVGMLIRRFKYRKNFIKFLIYKSE